MKYTTEIVVDVPRAEFIKKMDDPDNMKHWQKGLIGYEQLSTNVGQEGSRMSLSYEMGKRKMECIKAWFSCFAIKGTNDLSAVNCFVIAISFLVGFSISHNGF